MITADQTVTITTAPASTAVQSSGTLSSIEARFDRLDAWLAERMRMQDEADRLMNSRPTEQHGGNPQQMELAARQNKEMESLRDELAKPAVSKLDDWMPAKNPVKIPKPQKTSRERLPRAKNPFALLQAQPT
jgi:hypothetical protein